MGKEAGCTVHCGLHRSVCAMNHHASPIIPRNEATYFNTSYHNDLYFYCQAMCSIVIGIVIIGSGIRL